MIKLCGSCFEVPARNTRLNVHAARDTNRATLHPNQKILRSPKLSPAKTCQVCRRLLLLAPCPVGPTPGSPVRGLGVPPSDMYQLFCTGIIHVRLHESDNRVKEPVTRDSTNLFYRQRTPIRLPLHRLVRHGMQQLHFALGYTLRSPQARQPRLGPRKRFSLTPGETQFTCN